MTEGDGLLIPVFIPSRSSHNSQSHGSEIRGSAKGEGNMHKPAISCARLLLFPCVLLNAKSRAMMGHCERQWRGVVEEWPVKGHAQEMMRMPKYFLSCSRKMKVRTVWGTKRIPAGTRPCDDNNNNKKWHQISGCSFPLICRAVYPSRFIWFIWVFWNIMELDGTKNSSKKLNNDVSVRKTWAVLWLVGVKWRTRGWFWIWLE